MVGGGTMKEVRKFGPLEMVLAGLGIIAVMAMIALSLNQLPL